MARHGGARYRPAFPDQRPDLLASRLESFGLGSDRFLNTLKVFDAAERDLQTKLLELAAELRVRSSVELVRGNEVVARLKDTAECQQLCRMAV